MIWYASIVLCLSTTGLVLGFRERRRDRLHTELMLARYFAAGRRVTEMVPLFHAVGVSAAQAAKGIKALGEAMGRHGD